ncbi:MAG: Pyrolysin precursor [Candidatus Bathyarchaeota archaeon BA1]|nr:MAG: Pyrolysin precursor [Candidatus Bathyarchaeota archaeon BA1]
MNQKYVVASSTILVVLLTFSMLVGAYATVPINDVTTLTRPNESISQRQGTSQSPIQKIDGRLLGASPSASIGQDYLRIIVVARGDPSSSTLRGRMHVSYTLSIGSGYMAFGLIKRENLLFLSQLPEVIKVLPDVKLDFEPLRGEDKGLREIARDTSIRRGIKPGPEPTSFFIRDFTGAETANLGPLGVIGAGVKVAISDTGVDFGNPNLMPAVMRDPITDDPIALDADGQGLVLTLTTIALNVSMGRVVDFTKPPAFVDKIPINVTAYVDPKTKEIFADFYKRGNGTMVPTWISPWYSVALVPKPKVTIFPYVFDVPWFIDYKLGDDPTHYIKPEYVTPKWNGTLIYHFGFICQLTFYGTGPILYPSLVIDSKKRGVYDTVYVDLSSDYAEWTGAFPPDFSFYDEAPHRIGDRTEFLVRDFTEDGIPDISAGMIGCRVLDSTGFITGHLYSYDWIQGVLGGVVLPGLHPGGWFFGVMYDFIGHGTHCASSVASRGVMPSPLYVNGKWTTYSLKGIAPGASIMAVKMLWIGDVFFGWMWASGFDFNVTDSKWYYTGKHKADINSNSWGVSEWPWLFAGVGYDALSLVEDALSLPGFLDPNYPGTVFVHAVGNGGFGYGTMTSPGFASLSISVGATTAMHTWELYGRYHRLASHYGGPSTFHDDPISWTNRGPNALGEPKPDVMSVGFFGYVSGPINLGGGDGLWSWDIFGGTSFATSLTAGGAALVIQSLKDAGIKYTPQIIKTILQSTADDTGNDPFVQGSGRVNNLKAASYGLNWLNVTEAVKVFRVSTHATYDVIKEMLKGAWSEWIPPAFLNQTITPMPPGPIEFTSWFAGNLYAGENATATFMVENPSNAVYALSVSTVTHELVKNITFTDVSAPVKDPKAIDPLTKRHTAKFIKLYDITGPIPPGIDLMVVTLRYPFEYFWNEAIGNRYGRMTDALYLIAYDWRDVNMDGVVWWNETAMINMGYTWGTAQEIRIKNPTERIKFTPLIGVYQSLWGNAQAKIPFTLEIHLYKRTSWDWLSLKTTSLKVPPRQKATFAASLSLPPNAKPGTYSGFIKVAGVEGTTQITYIPVSFNVAIKAEGKVIPYVFGEKPTAKGTMYDNARVFGAFDWGWRFESGDRRIYKVVITDPTVNLMNIRLTWDSPSGIDVFVLDPSGLIIATTSPLDFNYLGGGVFLPSNLYLFRNLTMTALYAQVSKPGTYTIIIHQNLLYPKPYPTTITGVIHLLTSAPDVTPPTLKIAKVPKYVKGNLTIGFVASDDYWVQSVTYSLDGEFPVAVTGRRDFVINTMKLTDGLHSVVMEAIDAVGHKTRETIHFIVDNTPPKVEISAPGEGSYLRGSVGIHWRVIEENIKNVTLTINGKAHNVTGLTSYPWDTTTIADGKHDITITARDMTDHVTLMKIGVTVDNTKPSVSITSPPDKAELSGNVTIAFAASDANLKAISLIIDASIYDVTDKTTFTWDTTRVGDGPHIIKLVASDKAGNVAEASIMVTTINVRLAIEATRNMYLAIGIPVGLVAGVAVTWMVLKRKKAAPALPRPSAS